MMSTDSGLGHMVSGKKESDAKSKAAALEIAELMTSKVVSTRAVGDITAFYVPLRADLGAYGKTLVIKQPRIEGGLNFKVTPLPFNEVFVASATRHVVSKRRFDQLVHRWRHETGMLSSLQRVVGHRDYLRIIGMGRPALPWILEALRDEKDRWFVALAAIADEDPAAGLRKFGEAREAWLRWGAQHGLVEWPV